LSFLQIGRPSNRCTMYFLPRQNDLPHMKCRPWLLHLPLLYSRHNPYNYYSNWHLCLNFFFQPRTCCICLHWLNQWPRNTVLLGSQCRQCWRRHQFEPSTILLDNLVYGTGILNKRNEKEVKSEEVKFNKKSVEVKFNKTEMIFQHQIIFQLQI
jgi:hypothetical protein